MKRVLVTGGAGFVGARVVRRLLDQGATVALILRETSITRRLHDVLDDCTVIHGDLTELATLREPLQKFAPDGVIHMAWQGVKGSERNDPMQLINVSTSIDLFQLTGALGCKSFVGLGSQAEYGPLSGRIDEHAPTQPTTLYGATKLATCCVLERAASTAGRPFAWLRLFSSYGPDDDPSWLMSYLIRTLLVRERPKLTKAEQIWDYVHVDDVADAIVGVLNERAVGVFNLGSGQACRLHDIVTKIRDMIDPSLDLGFGEVSYRTDQVMHLEADVTALMSAVNWRPKITLESGLADLVRWHRQCIANTNMSS